MQRQPVQSSNVVSIGYDEQEKILEIEFKNGSIYEYKFVPKEVFDEIMSAQSIGSAVSKVTRGAYVFRRVDVPSPNVEQ